MERRGGRDGVIELLWNINREIIKRLKPFAADAGLSLTEAFVLWKTHKAGTKRVIALADELGLVPSTLTGVLDRLVEAGWLVRESDPEDRRAVVMKATAKMGELLEGIQEGDLGKLCHPPSGAPGRHEGRACTGT